MKRFAYLWMLALCTWLQLHSYAQQADTIALRFMDVELPLNRVNIYSSEGTFITTSDSSGYARLPVKEMMNSYAVKEGYEIYRIKDRQPVIYMTLLNKTLQEAVVHARTSQAILRPREYVVDYTFVGDNLLVATYSGNNGTNAKLFLCNNNGDTLALTHLPEEPLALYKSCTGKCYCIGYNHFYPLQTDSSGIHLQEPVDNSFLPIVEACRAALDNYQYFKIVKLDSFVVDYGYVIIGDTAFHSFKRFEDAVAFRNNREEDPHYTDEDHRKARHKYYMGSLTEMWNKGALHLIDMPLFTKDDSLLLFDVKDQQIIYYAPVGIPLKTARFNPSVRYSHSEILKDTQTDKFYMRHHTNEPLQQINEIAMDIGDLSGPTLTIEKPFARKVQIHDGNIYYLWQDPQHGGTQQLYVQKGF